MTCVGQVEIDPFCTRVLEKNFPNVPRWNDIKDARNDDEYGPVELVCGGYPCQPFSIAGNRRGANDDRHIWPHVFRIVQKLRPTWCLFENVAGHISMGLDCVLSDLESEGYKAGAFVIPACAVGAWHRRDRVWIISNIDSKRELQPEGTFKDKWERTNNISEITTNIGGERWEKYNTAAIAKKLGQFSRIFDQGGVIRPTKPRMVRRIHGVPRGMDGRRIAALGNAVVPQIVAEIGMSIMDAQYNKKG